MKKLITIFLSSALIFSLTTAAFSINAETNAYNIGDRPYSTANSKDDIVVSSGENLSFYDDFIVKDNIDAYNDTVPIISNSAWKLEGNYNTSSSYNSVAINTEPSYTCKGVGQSLKLTYKKLANNVAIPQGETVNKYYHKLTSMKSVTITNDFWDTATIAFWVKTENPVYILVRCLDYSASETKQFLISKEIKLSSGEYIVEVPLSGLAVSKDNYVKGNGKEDSANKTVLYYPEILVRPSSFAQGETERDIYIDNLGYYNIQPNGTQNALHNGKALTKLKVSDYEQDSTNERKIFRQVGTSKYTWSDCDASTGTTKSTISPAGEAESINANAYAGQGQSIKYTASTVYNYTSSSSYNGIKTNEIIYTSDKNGTFWGKDATLAIWVKSSRAIKVYAMAGDGKDDGSNYYKTDKEYVVPAGESILRIPISDFNIDAPTSGSCDRVFTWKSLKLLRLYFKCASPRDNTISNGIELYIDEIAIETPIIGDTNDDAVVNIIDLIRIKKYIDKTDYTDMDSVCFDVGGEQSDDNGFSIADGTVDSTDLTVMKKYLLGSGKIAIKPYSSSATATSLVATVSANWGFDAV